MPPNISVFHGADKIEPQIHDAAGIYSDLVGTDATAEHPLAVGVWDIYDFDEATPSGVAETTEFKYIVRGEAVIKNECNGETQELKPGSLLWIPAGSNMSLVSSSNCRAIYGEVRQMTTTPYNDEGRAAVLRGHLDRLISAFVQRNPLSKKAIERARIGIPGGTTRSVLDSDPFPLVVRSGRGATLTTVDGSTLTDFQSDFTAGLFGHSHPELRDAVVAAADNGFSLGAVTELEAELSEAVRRRFPSIEQVRYCNSGTEANLYAIGAALAHTGRRKVLVFDHGYHGGVLSFGGAATNPLNIPHDFVVGTYDDVDKTRAVLSADIGAIVVEPMQSAGGMRPASRDFLAFLRGAADTLGAVLIFDEVVTSRLDYHGMQGRLGVRPDMTTLGKYLGGGLPFGAFGGAAAVMAQFVDRGPGQGPRLSHSGTFNNNVFTMSAAVAAARLVTPDAIEKVNVLGDKIRDGVAAALEACDNEVAIVPLGVGSCVGLHFPGPEGETLREVLFLELLERGLWIGRRGFLALNFAHTDEDVDKFLDGFKEFLESYG